ncbi:MAG: bile acid:sodium symporter [bacterium]
MFQPYILYLVQIILFLSCLKIDFPSFIKTFKNPGWITYITFMVMILCPILFYTITKLFYPELAIGVLILTAMPTAMAAPAFTDITKGNTSLTLMFTIILTLLCPISIPLLIKYLLGVQIHIDLWEMFFMLIKVICIPFALALLTRNFLPSMIKKSKPYYGGLSIILLMLVIFPPLAVYRDYFFANPIKIFPMLIYLSLVSAGLHIF